MKKSDTIESVTKQKKEIQEKLKDNISPEERSRLETWIMVLNGKLNRLRGNGIPHRERT